MRQIQQFLANLILNHYNKDTVQPDALVLNGLEDEGTSLSAENRSERFFCLGDDRNNNARYIAGKCGMK